MGKSWTAPTSGDGSRYLDPVLWERLRQFVEAARQEWRSADHGIWEVSRRERYTYSAALCQVALDRGA